MQRFFIAGVLAGVLGLPAAVTVRAEDPQLRAVVDGIPLPPARVASIVVDGGTLDVDAATMTIDLERAAPPASGAPVDVLGGFGSIFTGEVVGVEPAYEGAGNSRVIVRAFNRLHRLTRGRKSRTFEQRSDADVVSLIAREAGLVPGSASPESAVQYDRIVQDNQTDLEFLHERAARIGFEVLVDDQTLLFRRPPARPAATLGCTAQALLTRFHPRLSSANQVSQVTVRGYDPDREREITGTATPRMIALSAGAMKITAPPGRHVDLGFVQALETSAASYGAAVGVLASLTAADLSAEAEADGDASLRAGATVSINGVDDRFDGKYQVAGVSHRFEHGPDGHWRTLLRLVRDDRAVYLLPEAGDDVLVAFESGDLRQPFVVGSLWNGEERPPESAPCGRRSP